MKLADLTRALTLAAAFAWSSTAFGVNCACEVATGACAKCCGAQDAGFKHCGINGNGSATPPKAISKPYQYDKAMPTPADLPPAAAPAAPEAAPEPYTTSDKAKPPGSTGKDRP